FYRLPLLYSSFFFSSRRRHTRFSRDWSSDVCSSDLFARFVRARLLPAWRKSSKPTATEIPSLGRACSLPLNFGGRVGDGGLFKRSEERRVGKECRSRW